jgi:hypothetical protein
MGGGGVERGGGTGGGGVERGGGTGGGGVEAERTLQVVFVALVPAVEVYVGVQAWNVEIWLNTQSSKQ